MPAKQENRQIGITTPLGQDVLLLQGLTITEELGRLFTIKAELLSTDDIIFEKILGQNVDIRMDLPEGQRYFNGYVSSFSQTSHDGTYARYHATIHPWLWFLTRSSDCRIFQNKTVPEIIKKVCSELGFTDIDDKLYSEYRTWEYCVQYRETNFNFLSRLMEQEGIYYFFSHEQGKHTLNLCDCYSSHEIIQSNKEIPYNPGTGAGANKDESIHHWLMTKEIQTGTYALNEYDSTRPKLNAHVDSSIIQSHANADSEFYDYPGEFVEPSDGANYARIRIEEQQTRYEQLQGKCNVRGLLLGGLFSLTYYPRKDQNQEYLLDSISQTIYTSDYTANGKGESSYSNSFTVINSKTPFRSARITPKPIVQGAQTAIVVGPAGEEIYTDKYGRVKVQFYWDRYGKADENSSCWVRVSQNRAGKGWGEMYIPHVDHEVIISFLEGDPDRPIITGRVYNGDNMPPVELPAGKTKVAMRDHGGNEMIMEGADGSQRITMYSPHAQTKFSLGAPNSPVSGITLETADNWFTQIGKDLVQSIDGDASLKTDGCYDFIVGGKTNYLFGGAVNMKWDGTHAAFHAGAIHNTFAGVRTDVSLAMDLKSINGVSIKHYYSYEKSTNYRGRSKNTKGKVRVDSDEEYLIVGGKDDKSKLTLNASKARLECGSSYIEIKENGEITISCSKFVLYADESEIVSEDFGVFCSNTTFHGDNVNFKDGHLKQKDIDVK